MKIARIAHMGLSQGGHDDYYLACCARPLIKLYVSGTLGGHNDCFMHAILAMAYSSVLWVEYSTTLP